MRASRSLPVAFEDRTFHDPGDGTANSLERAARHIIAAAAPNDSGSALARLNLSVGIAKILHVQDTLGYPQDACFVATPDSTPSREGAKWDWGLSSGGMLSWGDGGRSLMFLDLNVSTGCALVGGLQGPVGERDLIARITRIRDSLPMIMGVQARWDYGSGNHFINIYENAGNASLPPFVFIVHGSGREVKAPNALGIGLDYRVSPPLAGLMKTVPTPWGPCRILEGQAVRDLEASYRLYRDFALAKQRWVAGALFGRFTQICNEIHHGFVNANCAVLGCYRFHPEDETLFPITLRADLPAFLVKGQNNLDREVAQVSPDLASLLTDRVASANVLPHGGGMTYPQVSGVEAVLQGEAARRYALRGPDGSRFTVKDLRGLECRMRGMEVMELVERARLGKVVAVLRPLLSLTT